MKKLQIALIGIIGAVMVFLCVALGVSLSRGIPLAGGGNYSLVQEKKFPAQDIRSLKIDYGKGSSGSTDVLFYQGTGDEIIIREYMNYEPGQNQLSAIEQSGGELRITGAGHRFFSFLSISFRGAYVEVYLPAGFAGDMETLTVKTISGEISSKIGLTAQGGFLASTTSGDMLFPEVQAEKIQVSSTSGDIRLDSALAEKQDISTTSGDITVEQARGGDEDILHQRGNSGIRSGGTPAHIHHQRRHHAGTGDRQHHAVHHQRRDPAGGGRRGFGCGEHFRRYPGGESRRELSHEHHQRGAYGLQGRLLWQGPFRLRRHTRLPGGPDRRPGHLHHQRGGGFGVPRDGGFPLPVQYHQRRVRDILRRCAVL